MTDSIQSLLSYLVKYFDAKLNLESTDSGDKTTANFTVKVNPISNDFDIALEQSEWFRNNYPDGFEILRVTNFQQVEMPGTRGREYQVSFSMEILKKPEQITEEEVIEDEDETTLSTRNKAVIDAYLGDNAEEEFAKLSDAHKRILNKQMDLLHDLFALSQFCAK